jgi:NAD(P)-dependent dehydrogenase (short-subunit alcohol dehydrogenase family)
MRLKGKVAIVTGAASKLGIGRAIALMFAQEGAAITVADIDATGGEETAELVKQSGREAIFCHTDISDSESVLKMTQSTADALGGIHILVNNAAHMVAGCAAADLSEEQWDRSLDITLKGAYLCSRYAIPEMIKAGGGAIVNISSVGGVVGFKSNVAYCSAKGGIIQLTKCLAIDYGRYNIRANAICPGAIETGITPPDDDESYRYHIAMSVLARRGKPEEVACAALFLASSESSFVTGATLLVDGGWTAR